MSLDRDELTARFAVEYAVRNGFHPENAARQGREAADALLLALTPTPAPCPPPVAGRGEDDVRSAAQALIDEVERMFAAPYAEGVLFHREFKALKAALSRPVRP